MSWKRWVVAHGSPVCIWRLGIGRCKERKRKDPKQHSQPIVTIPMEGYAFWTHEWAS